MERVSGTLRTMLSLPLSRGLTTSSLSPPRGILLDLLSFKVPVPVPMLPPWVLL